MDLPILPSAGAGGPARTARCCNASARHWVPGAACSPGGRHVGSLGGHARTEEAPIPASSPLNSWAYAEAYVPEDDVLLAGRQRATEVGCTPILPGGGAALRFLAAMLDARSVVEIGTGTGVSGVWLLRGMADDAVLTTVESEAEHLRLARQTYTEAGFAPGRTRTILGRALDVLPRLADGAYDLVFCDGDKREYPEYLAQAHRLLRRGGVVAMDNALWHDRVADPAQRDPETVALRELGKSLAVDDRFVSLLLPVGDGLLLGLRR